MDINTCFETTNYYHTIAYYSHLLPIALALFLSGYALLKTKGSRLSVAFFAFTFGFSLWLVGDLVTWTSSSYDLVYFAWSWLDFVNILFYACGVFFFGLLARGRLSLWEKLALGFLILPALIFTATDQSLIDFYHPVCEATENPTLTTYKIFAEWAMVGLIALSYLIAWRTTDWRKRFQLGTVMGAILIFFAVFSYTEFIATVTDVYEVNLYGLFVLPLFLIVMVFSVTNLGIFQFRFVGTQILAYVLIIMVSSQLIFIEDSSSRNLSLITLAISLFLGLLLIENAKREAEARLKIEELNNKLDTANKQQVVLIHFITHQLKGFVTKSRNIFSMILEGDFGPVPDTMRPMVEEGLRSDTKGATTIQEILNAANIKSGKVTYAKEPVNLKELTSTIVNDLKPNADAKFLVLSFAAEGEDFTIPGDRMQLTNALKNLIDNSIKYTPSGSVVVNLVREASLVRLTIKDTGVGITPEDMQRLFTEGGHGKESQKVNVESTGFGLYIVKNIIEAHNGKVWAESEGAGKGSRFIAELPIS